jgi:hypothetical protein
MIEEIIVVVGLNKESECLEFRHKVAHQISVASALSLYYGRCLYGRLPFKLYLGNSRTYGSELASCISPLIVSQQQNIQYIVSQSLNDYARLSGYNQQLRRNVV